MTPATGATAVPGPASAVAGREGARVTEASTRRGRAGGTASARTPRFLAIVGPTGAGKTALALLVARRLGGEIISLDSRQIYRGMDIGTAKVTPAERALVPHHGLDRRNPDQPYCLMVVGPKVAKYRERFPGLLRDPGELSPGG